MELGALTRVGQRLTNETHPNVPASGPTPAVPEDTVGQYAASQTTALETEKGLVVYPNAAQQRVYRSSWRYYKMRGMDGVTNGLYDTWLVIGAPDTSAAQYAGSLTTPLRNIVIAASWITNP